MDIKLVMFKSDGQRKDIPITEETTVIGRGEDCGLRVPLQSVSRAHCELSVSGDTLSVKDLASSNGTYVNNTRINESPVSAGDRLVVGPVIFTVQVDGEPEDIAPVKLGTESESQGEEIVDLEADMLEGDTRGDTGSGLRVAQGEDEELDPIAALEALAAESEKDQEED